MTVNKKEMIMNAAVRLFAARGIDATPTQAITSEAGVGTGTLFKSFGSKEKLIVAAYVRCKKQLAAEIAQHVDPEADFATILKSVWETGVSWSLKHYPEHQFMMQVKNSPYGECEEIEEVRQELLFLMLALKGAIEKGEVSDLPIDLIELSFSTFWNCTVEYCVRNKADPEQIRNEMFRMLMQALRPE